jgi:hypothetical protein
MRGSAFTEFIQGIFESGGDAFYTLQTNRLSRGSMKRYFYGLLLIRL